MDMRLTCFLICFYAVSFVPEVVAEDYKIGVVNAIRILEQSPQAEKMRNMLKNEFASREQELISAQISLKEKEERLTKDAPIMSESERKKLERDILTQTRDNKRNQDEFREDITFRRNDELANIQKEIVDAINTVARENEFDMVLNEGVLYATPKVDISQLVIDQLRKENDVGKDVAEGE